MATCSTSDNVTNGFWGLLIGAIVGASAFAIMRAPKGKADQPGKSAFFKSVPQQKQHKRQSEK